MNKDALLSCFSRERECVTMREWEGEEGGGGGVKWQRKMSRGRERMIIYSLIRVIQDIRHKYIKH